MSGHRSRAICFLGGISTAIRNTSPEAGHADSEHDERRRLRHRGGADDGVEDHIIRRVYVTVKVTFPSVQADVAGKHGLIQSGRRQDREGLAVVRHEPIEQADVESSAE